MARVSTGDILHIRNYLFPCSVYAFAPLHSSSFSPPYSLLPLRITSSSVENKPSCIYRSTVSLFETCKGMKDLFQIQAHVIVSGLFLNPYIAARVLKYSADYGDIDYTLLIHSQVQSPHIYCVNTVIKAYSISSFPRQAVVFYFLSREKGFIPNSFTFPPLIISTAKSASIEDGWKCHGQAVKHGVSWLTPVLNSLICMHGSFRDVESAQKVFDEITQRDIVTWNSMIDAYSKCGRLGKARELFSSMPERNVVSWNVIITGEMDAGNAGRGIRLFRDMMESGVRGSDTTMVSMITACGRLFKLKEGRSVHGSLLRMFQQSLILDTALVDMYSRCERVDVARKVFDRMSEKNLVCWNAMILGHCLHGKVEEGLGLFEEMAEGEVGVIVPDEVTFIGLLCGCARAGLLTEGRSYLNKMVSSFGVKPNFAHHWCIANLLASLGYAHEAKQMLKSMMLDDPDASTESSLWAHVLGVSRFQGNATASEKIVKELLNIEPQNFMLNSLLLNIYAVAGRWEDVEMVKQRMKAKGFEKIPGCSLHDLKELVHNLRVGDHLLPKCEVECMKKDVEDGS